MAVLAAVLALGLAAVAPAAASTYTNPVISTFAADPCVIRYQGTFYMYPTGDTRNYHVWTSPDLINWTKGNKVFTPPGNPRNVWAPEVYLHTNGVFYLYYSSRAEIGVASCSTPDGTFMDQGLLLVGSAEADAHMFRDDDGKLYLYYGRATSTGGQIRVQQMADPVTKTNSPITVIVPDCPWETVAGAVTEGPFMIKHNGVYYLMYSGTGGATWQYSMGYATSSSPLGPFTKYAGNPILKANANISLWGPGHHGMVKDDAGVYWVMYQQKLTQKVGWRRQLAIDPLTIDANGVMHITGTRGTAETGPVIGRVVPAITAQPGNATR